jgi:phosphopantetheine--protein transferase-like protein
MPAQLEIDRGEHGKPHLVDAPIPLQFSLSHSGGWMACAVALEAPVGVDLEAHDPRRDVMPIARRFFREPECLELAALEGEARLQHFYDLWTLKEAYVKARGSSLARELETTGFRIDAAAQGLPVISPQPGADNAFYCLLSSFPGYSLALCSLAVGVRAPRIRVLRLRESGTEQVMPGQLAAASQG